jgi:hypothetical protein
MNKKFWEERIANFPLYDMDLRKRCMYIRCRRNVFTEPLPSSDRGIFQAVAWQRCDTHKDIQTDRRYLWSTPLRCSINVVLVHFDFPPKIKWWEVDTQFPPPCRRLCPAVRIITTSGIMILSRIVITWLIIVGSESDEFLYCILTSRNYNKV